MLINACANGACLNTPLVLASRLACWHQPLVNTVDVTFPILRLLTADSYQYMHVYTIVFTASVLPLSCSTIIGPRLDVSLNIAIGGLLLLHFTDRRWLTACIATHRVTHTQPTTRVIKLSEFIISAFKPNSSLSQRDGKVRSEWLACASNAKCMQIVCMEQGALQCVSDGLFQVTHSHDGCDHFVCRTIGA